MERTRTGDSNPAHSRPYQQRHQRLRQQTQCVLLQTNRHYRDDAKLLQLPATQLSRGRRLCNGSSSIV
jgi:hypothetical protein